MYEIECQCEHPDPLREMCANCGKALPEDYEEDELDDILLP